MGGRRRRARHETLHSRLQSCMSSSNSTLSVDQIVQHLRCTYPEDYQRTKLQVLTRSVRHYLQSRPSQQHSPTTSRKRPRPIIHESSSDRVQSGSEEEEEEEDEKFDLMKTMLRNSYSSTGTKDDDNVKRKKKRNKKNAESEAETDVGNCSSKAVSAATNEGGVENVEKKNKKELMFSDLGGIGPIVENLRREVIVPLQRHRWITHLGATPLSGILLHGPPGCGKTQLAHAIANECSLPFYPISATQLVAGVSGESEENIREHFSKACRTAPSVIFIDEIDAIAPKRDSSLRQMDNRIVTQLLTCTSELSSSDGPCVLVIGATNRPDALDPALRRPGRFDCEIAVGIPDESAREDILSVIVRSRNMKIDKGSVDLRELARLTPGFVGADLKALAKKAAIVAINRFNDELICKQSQDGASDEPLEDENLDELDIKMSDFKEAVKMVQPSLKREGFSPIPNVKWEDVGGLDHIREEFERYIGNCIKYPKECKELGVDLGMGFLLYGPPGCGKTLIAEALATEAGANFIHVKGPELLTKFVGESEQAVRTLFRRARTCEPCIIFFDEVDALTARRDGEGGSVVVDRVVDQILVELNGVEKRQGVFVVGATNRPEAVDPAILRALRFGIKLYVPHPTAEGRVSILKALARKKCIDAEVDLDEIARMKACENLSGAELAALMTEAALTALNANHASIKRSDFDVALSRVGNWTKTSEFQTSSIVTKNQDPCSSITSTFADLHKLKAVVENDDFYSRCCELMMNKDARQAFCSIPDEDHRIIFLKRMAYRD